MDPANLALVPALLQLRKMVCYLPRLLYILLVHALCTVPTGRPLSPMTQSGECTSMNVSWLPPNTGDQNGVITKYRLYYTTNNSLPLSQRTYMTMNVRRCTDRPNVKLTNLKAESQYFIAISAGTSLGFGPIVNVSGFPSSRRK